MTITISELNIYPVKSLRGISLQTSPMELSGLRHDRRWMVVTPAGDMLTQRTHPQMALVETAIEDDRLVLETFGMAPLRVPPADAAMRRIRSSVFGSEVTGIDVGDETADWLSQAIGEPCRLVAFPGSDVRPCDPAVSRQGDHTLYADGFPLLVLGQSSLDDLNARLTRAVTMQRFRPNIVVVGSEAFAEDRWREVTAGDIPLRMVQACARCSLPTVDPEAGTLAGPELIRTLSGYRERDGEIYFGVNATPDRQGMLSVGDPVVVSR